MGGGFWRVSPYPANEELLCEEEKSDNVLLFMLIFAGAAACTVMEV